MNNTTTTSTLFSILVCASIGSGFISNSTIAGDFNPKYSCNIKIDENNNESFQKNISLTSLNIGNIFNDSTNKNVHINKSYNLVEAVKDIFGEVRSLTKDESKSYNQELLNIASEITDMNFFNMV